MMHDLTCHGKWKNVLRITAVVSWEDYVVARRAVRDGILGSVRCKTVIGRTTSRSSSELCRALEIFEILTFSRLFVMHRMHAIPNLAIYKSTTAFVWFLYCGQIYLKIVNQSTPSCDNIPIFSIRSLNLLRILRQSFNSRKRVTDLRQSTTRHSIQLRAM